MHYILDYGFFSKNTILNKIKSIIINGYSIYNKNWLRSDIYNKNKQRIDKIEF